MARCGWVLGCLCAAVLVGAGAPARAAPPPPPPLLDGDPADDVGPEDPEGDEGESAAPAPAGEEDEPGEDDRGRTGRAPEARQPSSRDAYDDDAGEDPDPDAWRRSDRRQRLDEDPPRERLVPEDETPSRRPRGERPKRPREDPPRDRPRGDPGRPSLKDSRLHPLLVLPLQFGVGFLVANATSIFWVAAPVAVATAQVFLGDYLGKRRGAILPSVVGGFLGMAVCGLGPLAVALAFVVGIYVATLTAPALLGTVGPVLAVFGGAAAYLALLFGLPASHVGDSLGSAVAYYLLAEDKREGDREFHMPGLFVPSHPGEDPGDDEGWATRGALLAPPSVAMAF